MTNLASKIVFQHKVLGGEAFEKLIVCNTVRLTHTHTHTHTHTEVAQSCPTLWDPMDCSPPGPPGSPVHGIFQAWILEWVAVSFSRGSSWPRDRTRVSRIVGRCFTVWATREAHQKHRRVVVSFKRMSVEIFYRWNLLPTRIYYFLEFLFRDLGHYFRSFRSYGSEDPEAHLSFSKYLFRFYCVPVFFALEV